MTNHGLRLRRLVGAVGVVLVGGGIALASGGVGPAARSWEFSVVERANDTAVDLGPAGPSVGDMLVSGNELYDRANQRLVGRDQGVCFRTNVGFAYDCQLTILLERGTLVVAGPFYEDGRDTTFAVTGGTGSYRDWTGEMTVHGRTAATTEFDFQFRLRRLEFAGR
jgi:hypothetical protein